MNNLLEDQRPWIQKNAFKRYNALEGNIIILEQVINIGDPPSNVRQ